MISHGYQRQLVVSGVNKLSVLTKIKLYYHFEYLNKTSWTPLWKNLGLLPNELSTGQRKVGEVGMEVAWRGGAGRGGTDFGHYMAISRLY